MYVLFISIMAVYLLGCYNTFLYIAFDGVYEIQPVILEGCDPDQNDYVRQQLVYKIQDLLQEKLEMYYLLGNSD